MTFKNGVSLGGHASKAHPGASAAYTHKVLVRQAREGERAHLKKAKEWFTDHFVADPKGQAARGCITKIKVMLMNGQTPEPTDFKKMLKMVWAILTPESSQK